MPVLSSIQVRNYLGVGNEFAKAKLSGRHAVFCGPNGSGKTTMLSAVALFRTLSASGFSGGSGAIAGGRYFDLTWLNDPTVAADIFHLDSADCAIQVGFLLPAAWDPLVQFLVANGFCAGDPIDFRFDLSLRSSAKSLVDIYANGRSVLSEASTRNRLTKSELPKNGGFRYSAPLSNNAPLATIPLLPRQLASSIVYFPSLRRIEGGSPTNDLMTLAAGLGVVDWVQRASRPNAENERSRRDHQLIREFEREFAEFAGLDKLQLTVPEGGPVAVNVEVGGHLRPLSRLGSGIGECLIILFVAKLARRLDPPIDVFLLEEPELHLHPALQRKLIQRLCGDVKQLIVSTHSATVVNEIQRQDGLIFRTESDQGTSNVLFVDTRADLLTTLASIGVSAGDILQAHKVLWVEGPNDIPVFRKWVFTSPFRGSQNVAVVHLGGNSSILSQNFDPAEVANLNPRSLAVIDSEKNSAAAAVDPRRLEFAEKCRQRGLDCRILERRATENYLPPAAIKALYSSCPDPLDPFCRVPETVQQFSKARNAEIALHLTWADLDGTDLGEAIAAFLRS
jgi:energy-coupling factor transporter ATP-binding protein EcfA2